MRLFVTGDNHIGKRYDGHPARDAIVSERIDALSRMVEKADEEGCGLFVVTGDLFDNVSGIAQKHIGAVAEALSGFGGTVVVLPGNHDHYNEDAKVWQDFKRAAAGNVALLSEYKPYRFEIGDETVTIYPAFCDKKHSEPGENRLDRIKAAEIPDGGSLRIGVAHGAVEGESLDREGAYYLMKRGELYDIPMDIWLIGHTHVPLPKDLTEEFAPTRERIFNAGTHVQTDVSNNTEGLCFIIDIDGQKNVRAKKYVSGGLRFYRRELALTAGNMERELEEELSGFGDNSVVELKLVGSVREEEYADRKQILDAALGRFLEAEYDDSELTRLITPELVKEEFSETTLAAKLLTELLDDPVAAQLAYDLIQKIKEGNAV